MAMLKQLYLRKRFDLDPVMFPMREIRETITFDRMYVDLKNTTASLDNVEISIDENDFITLSYLVNGIELGVLQQVGGVIREVIVPKPHLIRIKWSASEDGKQVVLLFGREATIRIAPPSSMILVSEAVGLAKDYTLQYIAPRMVRWGQSIEPSWIYGNIVTAPSANSPLLSITVSANKKGYIYGLFISSDEANVFIVTWTSGGATKQIRIPFGGGGAVMTVFPTPLNQGLPADSGSTITVSNVNAGSTSANYQVGILYLEV